MFFSESRLLCSPEYLTKLIEYSKTVSSEDIELARAKIREGTISFSSAFQADKNNNSHISIYGPLVSSPDPFLLIFGGGFTTYQAIQEGIEEIRTKASGDRVYLHINSPGGIIGDVDNTWKAIMSLREDFEVIAINEGTIASAAYWLASAAHKIVSISETNIQGSIGAIAKYTNSIDDKETILTSKNAKYKHPSKDPQGFDEKFQKNLDDIEAIFIDRISQGRNVANDKICADFGQGAMLLSKDAKKVGMIDNIVTPSEMFLSDTDKPVTGDANKIKGDSIDMTWQEMLKDPGVQAEFAKCEAAALELGKELGKKEGKEETLAVVKNVVVYLSSDTYPQSVKDCALAVCNGETPKSTLDFLVSNVDTAVAAEASAKAEADAANVTHLPGVVPVIVPEVKDRTVEDKVAAVNKLKGTE